MAPDDKAAELLRKAIESGNDGQPGDFDRWREAARVALRVAFGEDDRTLARFDAIRYSLAMYSDRTPQSAHDNARRRGVRQAIALLEAALTEVEAHIDASLGPTVNVGALHPWVAGMAPSLWDGGHRRQAVEEAARSIEIQLRAKLGIASGTGVPLVTEAFRPTEPTPGSPRLRFDDFNVGSEAWTNAHEGAMSFGRGCMMRIRNLYVHSHEPSDQEALEALASLSLLARWIDEASVHTAEAE